MYRSQLQYFKYSANTLFSTIKFCLQVLIMEYMNLFCLIQNILHDRITSVCTMQRLEDMFIFLCSILGGREQNGLSQEVVTGEVQEHAKDALGQEHVYVSHVHIR